MWRCHDNDIPYWSKCYLSNYKHVRIGILYHFKCYILLNCPNYLSPDRSNTISRYWCINTLNIHKDSMRICVILSPHVRRPPCLFTMIVTTADAMSGICPSFRLLNLLHLWQITNNFFTQVCIDGCFKQK